MEPDPSGLPLACSGRHREPTVYSIMRLGIPFCYSCFALCCFCFSGTSRVFLFLFALCLGEEDIQQEDQKVFLICFCLIPTTKVGCKVSQGRSTRRIRQLGTKKEQTFSNKKFFLCLSSLASPRLEAMACCAVARCHVRVRRSC